MIQKDYLLSDEKLVKYEKVQSAFSTSASARGSGARVLVARAAAAAVSVLAVPRHLAHLG